MYSVIQLPARFRPRNDKEEVKHEASLRDKLQALRSKRAVTFLRAKAIQRAGIQSLAAIVGSTSNAVLVFLRSLRHLALGFYRGKLEKLRAWIGGQKWGRKRWALISHKSVRKMMQRTLGRSADKERQQQARIYRRMCRALARLGRSAIAIAHKRRRAESAAIVAQETVDTIMKKAAGKVAVMRGRERSRNSARVIQRRWRRVKSNQRAGIEAKVRVLRLLTSLPLHLREYQDTQRQQLKSVHETSATTVTFCIRRAAQQVALHLIQRVWRGYCERKRVRRIREWERKKFVRQRQRERLREARGALLEPSEVEKRRRKVKEIRMLARQEIVRPPLQSQGRYQRRRGGRVTLLDPLPLQSRPSFHFSSTGTKVQCVPFSRFEKIIARDARVNLNNVCVAIPVGHQEVLRDWEELKRGELNPLLVGKGRRRQKGALHTTYDWIPAHLLLSTEERETRRQRVTSPSVARAILEY
ncbi:hypothetical protein GN244_ATG14798 [Phytophthora infestans]|uniref:Uncharacterized protein n=1 Tax=Phytophthora infestans TaxID=4787 RepID=A0A833RU06_PHYIN|nr:hypothetical protein GN244_ATG14798 [Phytophthora infestans]